MRKTRRSNILRTRLLLLLILVLLVVRFCQPPGVTSARSPLFSSFGATSSTEVAFSHARQKLPMEWRMVRAATRNAVIIESNCPGLDPYKVLYGCTEIPLEDMPANGDHPRVRVPLDDLPGYEGQYSTAFGYGQFIDDTWDKANAHCGGILTDIRKPIIQNQAVICNMDRVGALDPLFEGAVYNPVDGSYVLKEEYYKKFLCYVGREWAGTPFSGYGQLDGVNSEKWSFNRDTQRWNFDCSSDADWAKYNANPAAYTSPALYKRFWDDFNSQLASENNRYLDEFLTDEQRSQLGQEQKPEPVASNQFIFPLKGLDWGSAPIGDSFGVIPTSSGGTRNHAGQDFKVQAGHPVVLTEASTIATVYTNPNGNACGIGVYAVGQHGRSWLYCHFSKVVVSESATVLPAGTLIGEVGSTGNSTGPHLHGEYREGGVNKDPREVWQNARKLG